MKKFAKNASQIVKGVIQSVASIAERNVKVAIKIFALSAKTHASFVLLNFLCAVIALIGVNHALKRLARHALDNATYV
jgi:hypothetical protein